MTLTATDDGLLRPRPFLSSVMQIEPQWIDYNGHLNMAYYNVLFDRAVDEAFELLGCGLDYVRTRKHSCFTAEVHVRYVRELHAGDQVRVSQGASNVVLPAREDVTLAASAVRIAAGHPSTAALGAMFGAIGVQKA